MTTQTILLQAIILTIAQITSSCASNTEIPSNEANTEPEPVTFSIDHNGIISGETIYKQVCKDCHDQGIGGAPRIAHKEDWLERSWLWTAVLAEHAKCGYKDMPAKGGVIQLDDRMVQLGFEYMLSVTFPEMSKSDPVEE